MAKLRVAIARHNLMSRDTGEAPAAPTLARPRPERSVANRHDSGACARGVRILPDQPRPACGSGFSAHPTGKSTPPLAPDDTAPRPSFASGAPGTPDASPTPSPAEADPATSRP